MIDLKIILQFVDWLTKLTDHIFYKDFSPSPMAKNLLIFSWKFLIILSKSSDFRILKINFQQLWRFWKKFPKISSAKNESSPLQKTLVTPLNHNIECKWKPAIHLRQPAGDGRLVQIVQAGCLQLILNCGFLFTWA